MTWVATNTRKKQSGLIASSTGWSRPSDWPVLPTVNYGDQKFVGLHAVFNHDSNFIALSATGAYTVDWGDGSAPENIASGVQANHVYDYATVSSQVTPRGYKTCVVTVIPQSGNLTGINLSKKHVQAGLNTYSTGWLEIAIGGVFSATGLVIGMTNTITHRMLESIIPSLDTSAVTNMSSMFYGCSSLQSIPSLDTSAVTNMSYMFYGCSSLQSIPSLDTSAVTNMASMFQRCSSLQSIPLLDTSAVTNMSYMFQGCSSLQSIPSLDTSAVTNMSYMFQDCYSLSTVDMTNINVSVSVAGCKMSKSSIVKMFNNLSTATGQAVTVSNNWGYTLLTSTDIEIATNKGWTIA